MCSILMCDKNSDRMKELAEALEAIDMDMYMPEDTVIIKGDSYESLMMKLSEADSEPRAAFIYAGKEERYGIETAGLILRNHPGIKIVFVCDSDYYIKELYEIDFTYRLQLPASEDELRNVMEKLSRTGRWKDSEYLTVRVRSNIFRIPLGCIFYFEKSYRKINIASEEGVFTFYGKLENLMDMLTDNFIRCHNSYIVNFDKVITMENSHLNFSKKNTCEDMKKRVPVSRTYYSDIRNRFEE